MRILIDIGIYLFGVLSGITCIALAAAGGRTLMKEEMKTAAYSDFQHAKPINPTLEIVKTALVGLFELNIAIIQRGILSGCLFAL